MWQKLSHKLMLIRLGISEQNAIHLHFFTSIFRRRSFTFIVLSRSKIYIINIVFKIGKKLISILSVLVLKKWQNIMK